MQTSNSSGCESDISPEGRGLPGDEQRARLLEHLSCCAECRERAAAAISGTSTLETTPLARSRSRAIRARLLERARNEQGSPRPSGGRRDGWRAGAGWVVAAGLAALLLSHHSFHRPLALGWVIAGVLGLINFGLVLHTTSLRSQLDRLRTCGPTVGSDQSESGPMRP
jgi:anti-sigma factor RsiW